jgi:hypothetical protein
VGSVSFWGFTTVHPSGLAKTDLGKPHAQRRHRPTVLYESAVLNELQGIISGLGVQGRHQANSLPTFGEPLPPNGRLGAKVDEVIVPEGLRKLLVHSEAERAKRSHGQPPLNYAVYNESTGSWEGCRFLPGKVSQAKLINRGEPARAESAAAANYES